MKKMFNSIKQWFKTITKSRGSRLAFIASLFSISLLITVTTAWFFVIKEVPQGSITTGTLDIVAKSYNADGTFNSNLGKLNEVNGKVTLSSSELFNFDGKGENTGSTVYLSLEKAKNSLDLEYDITFKLLTSDKINIDSKNPQNNPDVMKPEDLTRLGIFWYRITEIDNNQLDYSKATYGPNNDPIVSGYDPNDANYQEVLKFYMNKEANPHSDYVPYTPCNCPTDKPHTCTQNDPKSKVMSNIEDDNVHGMLKSPTGPDDNTNPNRKIIRIDYGIKKGASSDYYNNTRVSIFGELYVTQIGAFDDGESTRPVYEVSNEQQMNNALHNAAPGDDIIITKSFTYNGDLIFIKPVNLRTNGNELSVNGNIVYDFKSKYDVELDLTSGGNIRINKIRNNVGGDFVVNTPLSSFHIKGIPYTSKIMIGNNVMFNATQKPINSDDISGPDGLRISGVYLVEPDGFNPKDIYLKSNTKFVLDSDSSVKNIYAYSNNNKASDGSELPLEQKYPTKNIQIFNYGRINKIDLSNMKYKEDSDPNSDFDTKYIQVLIYNYKEIAKPLTLPSWSTPFKEPLNKDDNPTGNTKVVREINSSNIIVDPNSPGFTTDDIKDQNKLNMFVIENNPYNDYTIYYHNPADVADKDYSIKVALYDYYEINKKELAPIYPDVTNWLSNIERIQIISLESKLVTEADIGFLRDNMELSHLDLQKAVLYGNKITTGAFVGETKLTELILPDTIEYLEAGALNNTGLTRIAIPNSMITADVSNITRDGNIMKFIYINSNKPNVIANSSNISNSYIFVNESFVLNYEQNVDDILKTRIYPFADISTDDKYAVRKLPDGTYEMVAYTGNNPKEDLIVVGDEVYIAGKTESLIVSRIGRHAFTNIETYYEIPSFSNNVKTIGREAFADSLYLYNIKNFNQVTTIEEYAFQNCKSLVGELAPDSTPESIKLKGQFAINVENIGKYAFENCVNLFEVDLSGAIEIDSYAFNNCTNLSFITLDKAENIRSNAFINTSLYYIIFKDVSATVNDLAGIETLNETKIFAPNIITKGYLNIALPNTPILVKVDPLHDGTASIDGNKLLFTKQLRYQLHKNIDVSRNIGQYVINMIPNSLDYEIITCNITYQKGNSINTDYSVPSSLILDDGTASEKNITRVGNEAYYHTSFGTGYNTSINLTFEPGINEVGVEAFISTNNFKKYIRTINFGDVTTVNKRAFANVSALRSFNDDNMLFELGEEAFTQCSGLTRITLPELVTIEEDRVFAYCSNLVVVNFGPLFRELIGQDVFYHCDNVRQIFFDKPDGDVRFGDSIFKSGYITNLKIYLKGEIKENAKNESVISYVYEYGENFGNYDIKLTINGEAVTEHIGLYTIIRDYSFANSPNSGQLKSGISISSFNVDLADFKKYSKQTDFLPNTLDGSNVVRVGFNCYSRFNFAEVPTDASNGFENFVISKNLLEIGPRAFFNVTKLRLSNLENVINVMDDAFTGTDIYIIKAPQLLFVGENSFAFCAELRYFEAKKLSESGKNAFNYCDKLEKIDSNLVKNNAQFSEFPLQNLKEVIFGIDNANTSSTAFVVDPHYVYLTAKENAKKYVGLPVYNKNDRDIYYFDVDRVPLNDGKNDLSAYEYYMPKYLIYYVEYQNVTILKNYNYDFDEPGYETTIFIPEFLDLTATTKHTSNNNSFAGNESSYVRKVDIYSYQSTKFNGRSIDLGNNLNTIGAYAFSNLGIGGTLNLNNVTTLEGNTFSYNDITLVETNKLKHLTSLDFAYCTKLKDVYIYSKLDYLPETFTGCTSLIKIYLYYQVELKGETFKDCVGLHIGFGPLDQDLNPIIDKGWDKVASKIVVEIFLFDLGAYNGSKIERNPNISLTLLGKEFDKGDYILYYNDETELFGGLATLAKVVIKNPNAKNIIIDIDDNVGYIPIIGNKYVVGIEKNAFDTPNSNLITEITFKSHMKYYTEGQFNNLPNLKRINANNDYFSTPDGALYSSKLDTLYYVPAKIKTNGSDKEYTVNSATKHVFAKAFDDNQKLKTLRLGTNIETLGSTLVDNNNIYDIYFTSPNPPMVLDGGIYSEKLRVHVSRSYRDIYRNNSAFAVCSFYR